MRTTTHVLGLLAALVIAGCTNETPVQPTPAGANLSAAGPRCPGDFDDVDAVVGRAAALRRKLPPGAGDLDTLNTEIGRLHHQVDADMEAVSIARDRWEAAKRTLAEDAVALDKAIADYQDVGLPPAEPW